MSGGKNGGRNGGGVYVVLRPLGLLGVVAKEGYGHVISVEDSSPPFQLRDEGVVAVKADLARAAEVLGDVADELAVEIEVGEAVVFAVADQEHRLTVAGVESDGVAAVA